MRLTLAALAVATLTTALPAPTDAQEARRRWDDSATLEDDAVVTGRGVEWLYPVTRRVLLIR